VSTVSPSALASEAAAASLPPKAAAPHLPRQLSDAEFVMLRGAGPSRRVPADEVLFRKGELGHNMYIIETGEVRLDFGDGLPSKVLGPREYFGELALFIGNHMRVAGAVAHTACSLRIVEYPAFDYLIENEPGLLAQFMRRSFAYLVASEQQLIAFLKRRNEDLMVTLDNLRQSQSELSTANRLVRTDELTGLMNRRGLYEHLQHLVDQRVAGTHLGLLLIDLDHFKKINDDFGHMPGDRVLCAIASEVNAVAAPCDVACRIGGDEFALLVQLGEQGELEALAARIVSGIRALRFPAPLEQLSAAVSIGAILCDERTDWAEWYSAADAALYRAKAAGGNSWNVQTG
jgi:diguanylate cyclase (GGDEF)-like protein